MITSTDFYNLRLNRTILTKEELIKALDDFGTLTSLYEAKKYVKLAEKIRRVLPLHLQNELLK